jgi:hypothetical protein
MLDVSLHYLASNKKPAKNRTHVRIHTGTSEIMGLLILLEDDEVAAGLYGTVAQLRLDIAGVRRAGRPLRDSQRFPGAHHRRRHAF